MSIETQIGELAKAITSINKTITDLADILTAAMCDDPLEQKQCAEAIRDAANVKKEKTSGDKTSAAKPAAPSADAPAAQPDAAAPAAPAVPAPAAPAAPAPAPAPAPAAVPAAPSAQAETFTTEQLNGRLITKLTQLTAVYGEDEAYNKIIEALGAQRITDLPEGERLAALERAEALA